MNLKKACGIVNAFSDGFMQHGHIFKDSRKYAAFRDKRLRRTVMTAYYETDFYRRKYDEHGVKPEEISTIADLHKLPIVTKEELIDNFEDAIPRSLDRENAYLMGTSGSTGRPIQIYKDYNFISQFVSSSLQGIRMHRLGIPKVCFIMDNLSADNFESTLETYMKIGMGYFKVMTVQQDLLDMIKELQRFNPDYIMTYTGILREIATVVKNTPGIKFRLKKVCVGGEMLDAYTRQHIEEAFGCPCYNFYAATEGGFIAWECEHKKMHIKAEDITLEIVDAEGHVVPPGQDGHILMTCHDGGRGTPIIRYSGCSDISHLESKPCSCGVNTQILGQIHGRVVDSIHLPDGRIYHAFYMTIPMEKLQREHFNDHIAQYQIVQHDLEHISISLVRNKEVAGDKPLNQTIDMIAAEYQKLLGEQVKLIVQEVNTLPRTDNAGTPIPLVQSMIGKEKSATIKTLFQQADDKAGIAGM